jgi:SagB-type dehydrogenase family enzyme
MTTPFVSQKRATVPETVFEPAEAYIHWMRHELANGQWQADPAQPSLLYKVYTSVERVHLDTNIPLRLGISYNEAIQSAELPPTQALSEQTLSSLLYYAHGLTRFLRPEAGVSSLRPAHVNESDEMRSRPGRFSGPVAHSAPFLGRPVPSGGSLHPTELYLALGTGWQIPAGIYHYDSAHHALDQLRLGDFSPTIAASLPGEKWNQSGSLVLFPAVCLQKNHQKYTNLSYWLQTLDAGIFIEQLRFIARLLQLPATVHLRYLDAPLHHLLGLDTGEENIYAVLLLESAFSATATPIQNSRALALQDIAPLSFSYIQPFTPRTRSLLLKMLYASSLMEHLTSCEDLPVTRSSQSTTQNEHALVLPDTAPTSQQDIVQTILRRRTGMSAIESSPLQIADLAALFAPLREIENHWLEACHYQLYCIISRVETVSPGAYLYQQHTLTPVYMADVLPILSRISTGINIAPQMAPINLFLCADYRQALHLSGTRGLRMLGIEIGRMLQRMSLAAAASNLATHIHQSYHIEGTRKVLLRLSSQDQIPLASMMVGRPKCSQGGLFEATWY